MSLTDIPSWVPTVGALIGTIGVGGLLTVSEKRKKEPDSSVPVTATMISDRGIESLKRVLKEASETLHDDLRRVRDSIDELETTMKHLDKTVKEGMPETAGLNTAAILAKLDRIGK